MQIKNTPFLIVIGSVIGYLIFAQHVAWHCSSSSNGRKNPPNEIQEVKIADKAV